VIAVWTELHRLHEPNGEVWVGVRIPGTDLPARGEVLRAALDEAEIPVIAPTEHGLRPVLAVHDEAMVHYLESAFQAWIEAGYPVDPGQDRVVPYVFPHPDAVLHLPRRLPASRGALAGVYCMDTATLIGPGTYRAARSAADAALTAADEVLGGGRVAYAAVRPPGHHAGTTFFGGSCYLNNAAIAAMWLLDNHAGPVAIVDLDAHHGNGTQQIFYEQGDVLYCSLHVDPGAGWFPHFAGFADETGVGEGGGANYNEPLSPGSGDHAYIAALRRLCERIAEFRPATLVVSLGVDAGGADPESPLRVSNDGFAAAGALIAALDLPTVLVHEGGYALEALGKDVMAILRQFILAGGEG
jgi:acetoin utilization deacetylase AcuC-like enzyme